MKVINDISFIIPVYNIDVDFVQYCLDSLLKQVKDNDEVIIVDDGSTTDVAQYIDKFKCNNVYIIHKKNEGVSVARNVGLSLAKCKWICFIDPDDFVIDNSINEVRKYLASEKDIYIFDYYVKKPTGKMDRYSFFDSSEDVTKRDVHRSLLDDIGKSFIGCGVPWAHIYKSEFLKNNNLIFDRKCIRMQDNIFNTYAIEVAETFEVVKHAFYVYRYEHCANYFDGFNRKTLLYFPHIGRIKMGFYNSHDYGSEVNQLVTNSIYGFNFYIINEYCLCSQEDDKKKRCECLQEIKNSEQFEYLKKHLKLLPLYKRVCFLLVDKNLLFIYASLSVAKKFVKFIHRNGGDNIMGG